MITFNLFNIGSAPVPQIILTLPGIAQLLISDYDPNPEESGSKRVGVLLQNASNYQSMASNSRLSRFQSQPSHSADTNTTYERFKAPTGPKQLIADRKLKKTEAALHVLGDGVRIEATLWKLKPDRDNDQTMKEVRNLF